MLHEKCPKGHQRSWRCHQVSRECAKCETEKRRKEKEFQKALEMQEKRNRDEQQHSEHMAKLDELLTEERQRLREKQLSRERALAVQQKEKDLADAKAMTVSSSDQPSVVNSLNNNARASTPEDLPESGSAQPTLWQKFPIQPPIPADRVIQAELTPSKKSDKGPSESGNLPAPDWTIRHSSKAKEDWEYQKTTGGSHNGDIDLLMDLIGLEEVKLEILKIKAKIEVSIRQNADVSKDRLNVSFLGNPGTGRSSQSSVFAS